MPPSRLLILLSGGGRTFLNILDRCRSGSLNATIVGVVASRECQGANHARHAGIHTIIQDQNEDLSAGALMGYAWECEADLVILAGYLRKVGIAPELKAPVLNIHPALLDITDDAGRPRFGGKGMHGKHVHRAVIEAAQLADHADGPQESGCTVHRCDDGYDTGPILATARCPILPEDTPEALAERVFRLEQRLYPEVIADMLTQPTGH